MSILTNYRINKKRAHSGRKWWGNIILFLILTFIGFFMVMPLIYSVINSFKPIDELFAFPPRFFVKRPTFSNYFLLFKLTSNTWVPFSRYIFNSLLVTGVGTVGHVLIASMAAYPLAMYNLRMKWLFNVVVVMLLFNSSILWYPQYIIMSKTGLMNNMLAYILPQLALPLGLFLMKQFMEQIPMSIVESAQIDGASQYRVFFKIVIPQVKPAWLTLALFAFQGIWNQTSANSMIYDEELKLMNTAIKQIMNGGTARYGVAMAGAIVLIIPTIVFFLLTQSKVIQTMSHSGIK